MPGATAGFFLSTRHVVYRLDPVQYRLMARISYGVLMVLYTVAFARICCLDATDLCRVWRIRYGYPDFHPHHARSGAPVSPCLVFASIRSIVMTAESNGDAIDNDTERKSANSGLRAPATMASTPEKSLPRLSHNLSCRNPNRSDELVLSQDDEYNRQHAQYGELGRE